jgi:NAD(P)-dependent dehydrogenase (short-subunit alcohol dehydrogenase family)
MFHLGQAAARQMVRQGGGGSIVNVTSQLAEVARPERAAYVASKGGGRSLTHAMALELAPRGIRVNAIAPGPTLTGLTRASYADPERRRATITQIPLGRLGEPEDIAGGDPFSRLERIPLGDRQHGDRRWRLSGDLRRVHQ